MVKISDGVLGILPEAPGLILQGGGFSLGAGSMTQIPSSLLDKLKLQNNTGLGSASVQGKILNTRDNTMPVLDVVNTWLTNKLTADELAIILRNRSRFTFTIGVGDRRAEFKGRFRIATNWHGEDADNFLLAPDPWGAPPLQFQADIYRKCRNNEADRQARQPEYIRFDTLSHHKGEVTYTK
ncbi:hypothetical protein GTL21_002750 [Salmonella enterica]|nr:hypothetical protein [Salmonella enterica]